MKLRVFFTRHKLHGNTYRKTQEHHDFPEGTDSQLAYKELFEKNGALSDSLKEVEIFLGERIKVAPDTYISISSSSVVDEGRESATLETFKAHDLCLFDAMTLRNCLSRKPERKP